MTAREDREKEKFTKETVVKYFFDMSKSTYTIMVLGGFTHIKEILYYSFLGKFFLFSIFSCSHINYWLCNF